MPTEHEFEFEVTVSVSLPVIIDSAEWEEAQEYGDVDSLEALARDKVEQNAPEYLTMRFADNGVSESNIEIGDVLDKWEYDYQ